MKTGLTILLCIIFGVHGGAIANSVNGPKSKKEQKLYSLLEEDKYEKLYDKSTKILRKNIRNEHANYAMSAYYLNAFKSTNSSIRQKSNISKALHHLKFLPTESSEEFKAISDSLHNLLRIMAFDSSQKSSINNQYRNWLLVFFNDSVPHFEIIRTNTAQLIPIDSLGYDDSLRYELIKMAQKLEGIKYVYAGTDPNKGFDCSGFTQYLYNHIGLEIPHNSQLQSKLSTSHTTMQDLKPGDLVFFGSWKGEIPRAGHAGIVYDKIGDDITIIHCVTGGVSIEGKDSSWDRYWINYFLFGISLNEIVKK